MYFTETELKGAFLIEPQKVEDERGFFARVFCQRDFAALGLAPVFVQTSLSYNRVRGTLRGMHYQVPPHEEAKLVACLRGAIYDVVVDLRVNSSTYCRWISIELREDNYRMLYVPQGFAHGFVTLEDESVVLYQISQFHAPESERGIRWDDPAFAIEWPLTPSVISQRDRAYPLFHAELPSVG